MNCPRCHKADSAVIDTRVYPRSEVVRRRRCACGARWTSDEKVRRGTLYIEPLDTGVSAPLDTGVNLAPPLGLPPGSTPPVLALLPSGSGSALSNPEDSRSDGRQRRRRKVAYTADFLAFWRLYPNRVKKALAAASWEAEAPPLDAVKAALAWQVRQPDWVKDGGAFIPHPTTYLNQRRWEDEPRAADTAPVMSNVDRENVRALTNFVGRGGGNGRG